VWVWVWPSLCVSQHVFCKHAATAADFLPVNVTLNVCCPGAVPTDIPGWQMWRDNLGVMFPVLSWCLGARSTSVGIQPMMHLAGECPNPNPNPTLTLP